MTIQLINPDSAAVGRALSYWDLSVCRIKARICSSKQPAASNRGNVDGRCENWDTDRISDDVSF